MQPIYQYPEQSNDEPTPSDQPVPTDDYDDEYNDDNDGDDGDDDDCTAFYYRGDSYDANRNDFSYGYAWYFDYWNFYRNYQIPLQHPEEMILKKGKGKNGDDDKCNDDNDDDNDD
jgi:hypothetical protein